MQLQPGEKSILAYFTTDRNALQAVENLKSRGFMHVRVDSIARTFKKSRNTSMSYLSDLTGGDTYDRINGHGPLLAADPACSGLSSTENTPEVYSYLVTVVTDYQGLSDAKASLIACGAFLNG